MSRRSIALPSAALAALLSVCSAGTHAATVEVNFCVSFEMLEQTPYQVVSGDSGCASVTVVADGALPGQTVTATDFNEYWGVVGGVNTTGATITITERYSWNYSINVIAGPNETASGFVRSEMLGLHFDFGSGSYENTYTWQLENNMAVDGFYDLYVYGEASQTSPVPLPPAAALLVTGLTILAHRRQTRERATSL